MVVRFLPKLILLGITLCSSTDAETPSPNTPKNILWIYVEDLSPWIGAYGDPINKNATPAIDQLATKGTLFQRCYMPAPVCSATRSALITGAMQTTSGTHNHRSSRTPNSQIPLPKGWKTLPELFRQHGYATFNRGKDDYNFSHNRKKLYSIGTNGNKTMPQKGNGNFNQIPKNQPFFAQIQLRGGKSKVKNPQVTADDVQVPGYFPNTKIFKHWWAHHYNTVRKTDSDLKNVLDELKQSGRADNTIIFFFSDHGNNHSVRHKQFCYEGGLHVPLIIAGTGLPTGKRRNDLVSGLDISATSLALAGIPLPDWCQGQDLFAKNFKPRPFVISARDRCDYTIDVTRTVRTDRFRYLRNYKTDRPYLQPQYRDNTPYVKELHRMHKAGELSPYQSQFYFGKRPQHELYDLQNDPHELNNLANNPQYAKALQRHINILEQWQKQTGDLGMKPEPEAGLRATLKRWKHKCVNPEFEPHQRDNE